MQQSSNCCNKKAEIKFPALISVSVIRLRRTSKACAPKEHLSLCVSGACGGDSHSPLNLTLILLPLHTKDATISR